MAVVKATNSDINLLARLLRAEAEGEGNLGMLLVGNVAINRVRVECSDFKGIRTIRQMVFQPHAFEATQKGYFYQAPGKMKKDWPAGTFAVNGFGPPNSACGTSGLPVPVPRSGTASRFPVNTSFIAFMNRPGKHAKKFTIPGNN